jgi:hypothetical protein
VPTLNEKESVMKKWLLCASIGWVVLALPVSVPEIDATGAVRMTFWANACVIPVPEIDATGAVTALGLLAGVLVLSAEQLRRK